MRVVEATAAVQGECAARAAVVVVVVATAAGRRPAGRKTPWAPDWSAGAKRRVGVEEEAEGAEAEVEEAEEAGEAAGEGAGRVGGDRGPYRPTAAGPHRASRRRVRGRPSAGKAT